MKDKISKYTVINNINNITDFEFEGTAIDFAHAYADNIYGIRDIGYASDIHNKYKTLLDNNKFSDEHTHELVSKIQALAMFDKDTVIFTNINYRKPLISSDFNQINPAFRVESIPQKNMLVSQIESLGYSIQATSQSGGESRLYLVEDSVRVASVNFYHNKESIQKVREKLAGESQFRGNTYLSNALNSIHATALAHSMVNDRLGIAQIEAMVAKLPDHLKQEYSDRIDKFGGKVKEEAKIGKTPEKEMLYIIHAKSLELTDGKPVNFTNEFVGTERDFNEYKDTYGKNSTMKAEVVRFETFAPEFRATHREIDKIMFAYTNNTGDKSKMFETLKTFDDKALEVLVDRLEQKGIDPKKFESDMKEKPHNKIKPKM